MQFSRNVCWASAVLGPHSVHSRLLYMNYLCLRLRNSNRGHYIFNMRLNVADNVASVLIKPARAHSPQQQKYHQMFAPFSVVVRIVPANKSNFAKNVPSTKFIQIWGLLIAFELTKIMAEVGTEFVCSCPSVFLLYLFYGWFVGKTKTPKCK